MRVVMAPILEYAVWLRLYYMTKSHSEELWTTARLYSCDEERYISMSESEVAARLGDSFQTIATDG